MALLLLVLIAIPVRAQLDEELRREEIPRINVRVLIARAGTALDKFDDKAARAVLESLIAELAIASHPGEEIRRRLLAALSMLNAGEVRGANSLLQTLFVEISATDAELSRAAAGEKMREFGRALLGDTVPATMTAAIEDLNRQIEPFPSYYRTWTRRQLEALHFACARKDLAQAQDQILILVKGVGEASQDVTWRNFVEAEWTKPLADERTRGQVVLAALRTFPTDIPVPAKSPYDHWSRVHGAILLALVQGDATQLAAARREWTISLNRQREF